MGVEEAVVVVAVSVAEHPTTGEQVELVIEHEDELVVLPTEVEQLAKYSHELAVVPEQSELELEGLSVGELSDACVVLLGLSSVG